ncbi:MAG: hypothetical protein E6Q98_16120 [Rhodospirillaceae bacterium]|nr:MAG: hypothetical protein E6Q98_16120 [Rhodospirillaceae bacterium]
MSVDIWTILSVLIFPLAGFAFLFLWRRIEALQSEIKVAAAAAAAESAKIWAELSALRTQLAAAQLENERRYVNQAMFTEFKVEFFRRFDRLEGKIDSHHVAAE